MSFQRGYTLGDADGPDAFLEGVTLAEAVEEASKIYPKHTPLMYDGDLFTTEREEHGDLEPNPTAPAKMPGHALRNLGLSEPISGRPFSADEVMALSEKDAHRLLLPYFQVERQGWSQLLQRVLPAVENPVIKAYDTPSKMKRAFMSINAKMEKAAKKKVKGVRPGRSRGPNLMPHRLALDVAHELKRKLPMKGLGLCVGSNDACRSTCLLYTGNNPIADKQNMAKYSRIESLLMQPVAWLRMLVAATEWHVDDCKSRGLVPYVRPNVLSDIPWELVFPDLFDMFPKLSFYDYTKVPGRTEGAKNYDLTFSFSGSNMSYVEHEFNRGRRIAVVFWMPRPCAKYPTSPRCQKPTDYTFLGQPVLDGDKHDFRPLDPPQTIIGLSYKVVFGTSLDEPPTKSEGFIIRPQESLWPRGRLPKAVVPSFRDEDTGAILVAGTPAQLGASAAFEESTPTFLAAE